MPETGAGSEQEIRQSMSNILWLASYPKSWNTWIRAFLHNYIEDDTRPACINELDRHFEDESKPGWYAPYTDRRTAPQAQRDIAASRPGKVIVKTHGFMGACEAYPLHDMSVTAGAIYVVRHPLDVLLSVADHFGLTVDAAIDFMNDEATGAPTDEANVGTVLTSWTNPVASWTGPGNRQVHVVRFEDLLDRPVKTFSGIVDRLGLGRQVARVERAVEASSFRVLRAQEHESGFVECSPSRRFFRSGRKLQWPGRLTGEQISRLVSVQRHQMRRFRYRAPGV
jgi:hypothetical protein